MKPRVKEYDLFIQVRFVLFVFRCFFIALGTRIIILRLVLEQARGVVVDFLIMLRLLQRSTTTALRLGKALLLFVF